MRIGITDPMGTDDKFDGYAAWIRLHAPGAEVVRLSYRLANADLASGCEAILLTGGGDVDPALYGLSAGHPKAAGVDADRDRFEAAIVDEVLRRPRPFLGICRGMQFVNVHLGGTLHPDVEDAGFRAHRARSGPVLIHPVAFRGDGVLSRAVGDDRAMVNSYHHQAVDTIAPALRAVAFSDDGLVEALEYPGVPTQFLLVQWHPERMEDQSSPCAGTVARLFLEGI